MKGRFRALVAHPHVEALGELAEILRSTGLQVETARSTIEALNKLRGHTMNVIVAQHAAGTFDGVGLLEASIPHAPEAVRIALVSSPDQAVELDYRPADGSGTIVRLVARPSERSRLVALVGEATKLLGLVEEQRELVRGFSIEQTKLQRRELLLDTVVRERTKGSKRAMRSSRSRTARRCSGWPRRSKPRTRTPRPLRPRRGLFARAP